jgi:hypothetical protein
MIEPSEKQIEYYLDKWNSSERSNSQDISLVKDISKVKLKTGEKCFYSFATKYCSHFNDSEFPIYDSYVEKVLVYLEKQDKFAGFKKIDLRDYKRFKEILVKFREFYGLKKYSLKDIDKYLWLLGKDEFNKY